MKIVFLKVSTLLILHLFSTRKFYSRNESKVYDWLNPNETDSKSRVYEIKKKNARLSIGPDGKNRVLTSTFIPKVYVELDTSIFRITLEDKRKEFETTENLRIQVDRKGNYKINQYTVIKKIGRGSYGNVSLCEDESKNLFAIKAINRKSTVTVLLSNTIRILTVRN